MAKSYVMLLAVAAVSASVTLAGSPVMAKVQATVPKPLDEQTAFYKARLKELLVNTEYSTCLYAIGSGSSLRNRTTSVPRLASSSEKEVKRIILRQPDANWSLKAGPDGDVALSSNYRYNLSWSASATSYEEVEMTDQETFIISADGAFLKSFSTVSSRIERSQSNDTDKKEYYRTALVECPGFAAAPIATPKKLKVAAPAKHACDFSQFENPKESEAWRALTAAKLWTKINQRNEDSGSGALKASLDPAFLDSERGHLLGISFDRSQDDSPADLLSTCLVETGKDPRAHIAMFGDVKIAKQKDAGGFIVGIADPATVGVITFVTPKNVYQLNRTRGSLTVQNERTSRFETVDPRSRRGLDRRLGEFLAKHPDLGR